MSYINLSITRSSFLAIAIYFTLDMQAAWAQSGVFFERMVTFEDASNPVVEFEVEGAKTAGSTSTIRLEFGSDDSTTTLPLPSDPSFELARITTPMTGCGPSGLPLIDDLNNNGIWQSDKQIKFNDEDTSATTAPRGIFKLDIIHKDLDGDGIVLCTPATTPGDPCTPQTETWRICLTGFPSGGIPRARLIGYLSDTKGKFSNVTPLGPSAGPDKPNIYTDISATAGSPLTFTATTCIANDGESDPESPCYPNDPLPSGTGVTIRPFAEDYPSTPSSGDWDVTSSGTAVGPAYEANAPLILTYTPPDSPPCCNLITFRFEVADASGNLISENRESLKLTGSCSGSCPPCLTKIVCPKVVAVGFPPKCLPPSGPPWPGCPAGLSCPGEWGEMAPLGFDRVITTILPLREDGSILGSGRTSDVTLNVTQGEVIGDLIDHGDDSYSALIQYEHGRQEPGVGYTVGNFKTTSVPVGMVAAAEANSLRDRANIVTGILVLSLFGNGFLLYRGRRRELP